MQFKKLIIIASIILAISGCATSRTEDASNAIYQDVKTASLEAKSISTVTYGKFVLIKIIDISPSIATKTSTNKFETVSLVGEKGKSFTIEISAICDCIGFRKWAVSPIGYLLDTTGDIVVQSSAASSLTKILKGVFPEDGKYKLVVMADNTYPDKQIGTIAVDSTTPVGNVNVIVLGQLPEVAHPTGTIIVSWKNVN